MSSVAAKKRRAARAARFAAGLTCRAVCVQCGDTFDTPVLPPNALPVLYCSKLCSKNAKRARQRSGDR